MTTGFSHRSGCTLITDLEELIVMDILSRLPLKTIVRCKCVSKTWFHLLLDPHFAKIHFSRSRSSQILGSYDDYPYIAELDESLFISAEGDEAISVDIESISLFRKFPYPLDYDMEDLLCNVANGFVLISEGWIEGHNSKWEPCHICNPITGQYILVQQTEKDSCKTYMLRLGFSKINELKVLRVVCDQSYDIEDTSTDPEWLEADIYRLSTNSWTNIGKLPYNQVELGDPFVNGAIHSISFNDDGSISSFDFEEEKFATIPGPPSKEYYGYVRLDLLQGCLCMNNFTNSGLEIWVMSEYGIKESWTKRYVINDEYLQPEYYYKIFRVMKNYEILLFSLNDHLIAYDPKTRSRRSIRFRSIYQFAAVYKVPFIPSFIRAH